MAISSSSFKLAFIEEVDAGVTPTGAQMQYIRVTDDGIDNSLNHIQSEEITGDRQTSDLVLTGAEPGGDTGLELSYGSFDSQLEGVYFNSWTSAISLTGTDIAATSTGASGYPEIISTSTDFLSSGIVSGMWIKVSGFTATANSGYKWVRNAATHVLTLFTISAMTSEAQGPTVVISNSGMLQNGTEKKTYTYEKDFGSGLTNRYQPYVGCVHDGLSLTFASGEIVGGSFTIKGTDAEGLKSTSVATSVLAASTTDVLNGVNNVGTIILKGTEMTAHTKQVGFKVNNNVRGLDAIGTLGYFELNEGDIEAEADVEFYLENTSTSIYQDAIDNVDFDMSFPVTDADGNRMQFSFYRGKLKDPQLVAGAKNNDVMISGTIQWIKGSVIQKTMQIDKFDA